MHNCGVWGNNYVIILSGFCTFHCFRGVCTFCDFNYLCQECCVITSVCSDCLSVCLSACEQNYPQKFRSNVYEILKYLTLLDFGVMHMEKFIAIRYI